MSFIWTNTLDFIWQDTEDFSFVKGLDTFVDTSDDIWGSISEVYWKDTEGISFLDTNIIFRNTGDYFYTGVAPTGPTVASTPVAVPTSGEYDSSQTIVLSTETATATIYYTTDGSTPDASDIEYTGLITIFEGTLKAISIDPVLDDSDIMIEVYTIALEQTATPVILPISGEYEYGQTFEITCATEGSVIYYTTDGTTPDITDNVFSEPVLISNGMDIKAIGVTAGYSDSDIAEVTYTIKASQPIIVILT